MPSLKSILRNRSAEITKPVIRFHADNLEAVAGEAEVLLAATGQVFCHGGKLMVRELVYVRGAIGKSRMVPGLKALGPRSLCDQLAVCANWRRFDGNQHYHHVTVACEPPLALARCLIERAAQGKSLLPPAASETLSWLQSIDVR